MPEKISLTLSNDELSTFLAGFNELAFVRAFGVKVYLLDECHVRSVIDPLSENHRGGIQSSAVNGGVMASMFDLALGMPGLLRAQPDLRTATVQLSMSFMKAVRGNKLEVVSWIARAGAGLLFTEAELRDEAGEVCASALGVVRMLEGHSEQRRF
ncbi:MAG: PaaI family thioesterase [Deltaproteobacteria bacterium]|nr:PaaI family thioesterase [Deltaproteobacteria bacterium]